MARSRHAIQKAHTNYLSKLDGFQSIVSLIKLAPDKTLILANNEITVGEIYTMFGDIGERLFPCPASTTWKTIDKAGVFSDFPPVLNKKKRK